MFVYSSGGPAVSDVCRYRLVEPTFSWGMWIFRILWVNEEFQDLCLPIFLNVQHDLNPRNLQQDPLNGPRKNLGILWLDRNLLFTGSVGIRSHSIFDGLNHFHHSFQSQQICSFSRHCPWQVDEPSESKPLPVALMVEKSHPHNRFCWGKCLS